MERTKCFSQIGDEVNDHRESGILQWQLLPAEFLVNHGTEQWNDSRAASHIYEQCDRVGSESSDVGIDLKLLPSLDMSPKGKPSSVMYEMPDKEMYKASQFSNSALQNSKSCSVWIESDPDCTVVLQRKYRADEIEEIDIQQYLASDREGEEDRDALPVAGPAADQPDMKGGQLQAYRRRLKGLQGQWNKVKDRGSLKEKSGGKRKNRQKKKIGRKKNKGEKKKTRQKKRTRKVW